ncbi:hypothetical protein GCM10011380_08650 [Sphingomonas metalli]|uniref:HIRAN domain-containing protein n=1 Tax=Sphingomonas metalli TaxID=1779358 RepID=A0A916SZF7_9SPHN|nr:HIRAN domain-containing protein [Sphingomonas metalli]GGB21356.1 hypothetical protein GCM10011380_08650 [Sphingomonas metalli]
MFYSPSLRPSSPYELSLAVVGLDYLNSDKSHRRFEMALCAHGEPVKLIREPKNKADKRAIAVFSVRDIQLGYLTAERAALLAPWMDAGVEHEAAFQAPGRTAAIIRARFGGGQLYVPPERDDVEHDWSEVGGDYFDWGC